MSKTTTKSATDNGTGNHKVAFINGVAACSCGWQWIKPDARPTYSELWDKAEEHTRKQAAK